MNAALNFEAKRKRGNVEKLCPQTIKSTPSAKLEIINSKELKKQLLNNNKVLVCSDLTTRPFTEFKTCNFDFTLPGAVSKT